jgi:hypothetical protein
MWLEGVAPSAQVVLDLYPMLIHGVEILYINTADQQGATELLQEQNTKLHGNLQFLGSPGLGGSMEKAERYIHLLQSI